MGNHKGFLLYLVGTELSSAASPSNPVAFSTELVVGGWCAATAATSGLEGATGWSGWPTLLTSESWEPELGIGNNSQAEDSSNSNKGFHCRARKKSSNCVSYLGVIHYLHNANKI